MATHAIVTLLPKICRINADMWLAATALLSLTYAGQSVPDALSMRTQGMSMLKLYTQTGALFFAVILGAKRAIELAPFAASGDGFITGAMCQLVAGASLLRFAVDQNEHQGLGDGISLLICAGIGSRARPPLPD